MKTILKLMQGNQSKGLFMWKGRDPSTSKILEGSSPLPYPTSPPPPIRWQGKRESLGGWGKETDDISGHHPSTINFLYLFQFKCKGLHLSLALGSSYFCY